jgi:hypothetical protein
VGVQDVNVNAGVEAREEVGGEREERAEREQDEGMQL